MRAQRSRSRFRFLTGVLAALCASGTAWAFQPSPTTPYTFGKVYAPRSQDQVGDGNWHDNACTQSGPPNYFCPNPPCPVGVTGDGSVKPAITPPIASIVNGQLKVEYFLRNAYCNPPADGGDVNQPNSIPYYITIVRIDASGNRSTVDNFDPYWEHGSVSNLTAVDPDSCYQAIYVLATGFPVVFTFVSSNAVGLPGSKCGDDPHICPFSAGNPINVGSGNMRYEEMLLSVGQNASSMSFGLAYNSSNTLAGPLGYGFTHTFSQSLTFFSTDQKMLVWTTPHGEQTLFYAGGTPGSNPYNAVWPGDAREVAIYDTGQGRFSLTDLEGTVTQFDAATGHWLSTTDRWGNAVTGGYTSGSLTTVTDPEGRVWTLGYSGTFLSSITDGDGNQWRFTVDGTSHLINVFDPLHTGATPWRTYTYVTGQAGDPMVLAQVQDESLAVLEAHEYDATGRSTSSWSGDTTVTSGVPHPGPNARSKVTLSYDSATQTTVTSQISATSNLLSTFTLTYQAGRYLPTSIVGNCPSCGGGGDDSQTYAFDGNNHPLTKIVGVGAEKAQTNFTYDGFGMVLTKSEAIGKPEARTTTYTYGYVSPAGVAWPAFVTSRTEPSAAKPGQSKVTMYAWNTSGTPETTLTTTLSGYLKPADSSPTIYTSTTLFDAKHRRTQTSGPATNQKSTFAYYGDADATLNRRGRLQTSAVYTSASAHLDTTFDTYDVFGTAKKVVDPNAVETSRTTDRKGRVLTVVSKKPASDANEPADYTTTDTFDTRDRLTDLALPIGNKIHYGYEDGTNRLLDTIQVDTTGKQQSRMHLTLNVIGGKTKEEAQRAATPRRSRAPPGRPSAASLSNTTRTTGSRKSTTRRRPGPRSSTPTTPEATSRAFGTSATAPPTRSTPTTS